MPVQGDMIFTLGTNPVAEAMGKAAEPRLGQVLPSHPMAGQENNSFGAPHPGHLTSAGAATFSHARGKRRNMSLPLALALPAHRPRLSSSSTTTTTTTFDYG